ncbi:hypothetical protein Ancab_031853 [Ancistrocladus abbreviatus]
MSHSGGSTAIQGSSKTVTMKSREDKFGEEVQTHILERALFANVRCVIKGKVQGGVVLELDSGKHNPIRAKGLGG